MNFISIALGCLLVNCVATDQQQETAACPSCYFSNAYSQLRGYFSKTKNYLKDKYNSFVRKAAKNFSLTPEEVVESPKINEEEAMDLEALKEQFKKLFGENFMKESETAESEEQVEKEKEDAYEKPEEVL